MHVVFKFKFVLKILYFGINAIFTFTIFHPPNHYKNKIYLIYLSISMKIAQFKKF